jgi:coenzyme F420-0:L-glutamate ligase / coenzyme F420-1:gamma-L-glutamate ligase
VNSLQIIPIHNVPEIVPGVNIGECLRSGVQATGLEIERNDIVAVTQKIISKAEGQIIRLDAVSPSAFAISIAEQVRKDPRLIEVILRETRRIVRMRADVLICETHHGFICANAGVDSSNIEAGSVSLLPKDPDRSARELAQHLGCGVIVTDTFGRVWRDGLLDAAIGISGVPPLLDLRGKTDTYGNRLEVTVLASADALAAAAGLAMGKTQRTPAALIKGFHWEPTPTADHTISALLRAPERDLFL